jgi:formylglycine-generating enzyme required for sulfatase activity
MKVSQRHIGIGILVSILSVAIVAHADDETPRKTRVDEGKTTGTGTLFNSLGMIFVLVPPGSFRMGSPANEAGRNSDETHHRVTISEPFYMQTTEVTQRQWREVMGNSPSYFKGSGDECPVEQVAWNDVQEFIRRLNHMFETSKYRLPTEAEWEYACRAGTDTQFFFGNCLSTDDANYDGNYPMSGCAAGEDRKGPVPVGSFSPNAWGLYDMHGNVWEWCQDWYGALSDGDAADPTGPSSGFGRTNRGGSWFDTARSCRSAYRYNHDPNSRYNYLGFRLAMTP